MSDPVPNPTPDAPALTGDEAHVWRIDLRASEGELAALRQTLSLDEVRRSERFVFARDRDRFVVARGTMRSILARYLGVLPTTLDFGYTSHGKPFLASDDRQTPHFNLSHSHDMALLAVARHPVGIDIELIRENIDYLAIGADVFSQAENTLLRTAAPNARLARFFGGWTRKEAYIKAHGKGLSLPLQTIDLSAAFNQPTTSLWLSEGSDHKLWAIQTLDAPPGYAAALVIEGKPATVGWFEGT